MSNDAPRCTWDGCTEVAWMAIMCVTLYGPRPPLAENVCMPHVAATLRLLANACDAGEAVAKGSRN